MHELRFALTLGLEPRFAHRARLTVGLGPSLLLVTPRASLLARRGTTSTAPLVQVALSRAFDIGRFALVPALGLRVQPTDQGVRLDGAELLRLKGAIPTGSLALVYRLD